MKRATAVLVVVLGVGQLGTTAANSATSWRRYENPRFGYVVSFPSTWTMEPEAGNGDGRVIRSKTRDSLTVYGGFAMFAPFGTDYPKVTLRKNLGDGWVESGYTKGGAVFYARLKRSDDIYAVMILEYPKSRKSAMDPIVARMSNDFQGPCSVPAGECP